MKKYSLKKVLTGLAVAGIFILLAHLLSLAIKFGFRIILLMMENPVEALATSILFTLVIWAYSTIREWETPETK